MVLLYIIEQKTKPKMTKKEKLPIIRGIYLMVSPTNKHYVGKAKDCYHRQKAYHKPSCKNQKAIYESLLKYGFNEHSWQIIHILEDDEETSMLNHYERYYIKHYRECGYEMLNLTEGGDGVEYTPEVREKLRITNKYFQFEVKNIITGNIELTSNIELFCENNGNIDASNLNSTLYLLNNRGYNCYKDCDFIILSKIHLRDNKLNDETQEYIKNERLRRKNLKYARELKSQYFKIEDEGTPQTFYAYGILNIKTNVIKYYANLTKFCKNNDISCTKNFNATLYGYDKHGNKKGHSKNFKIVSKHLLRFDLIKDTKLQQKIAKERLFRLQQREFNDIVDRHSEQMLLKRRQLSEKYVFKILQLSTNKIIPTNNLTQFCLEFCDKSQSTWLSNSLYGYSHKGNIVESYKGYKIISKHYINPNLDDTKLQQEIEDERLRRSLLRKK